MSPGLTQDFFFTNAAHRKSRNGSLLLAAFIALLPAPLTALTIIDNFTNPANWGAPFTEPGANIFVSGGRMNYTCNTTNEGGAFITRNGPLLTLSQDWSLIVDVHVDAFTLITNGHFIDVFLGFGKTGDLFDNHVTFEFDRGWWTNPGYDIQDDVDINGDDTPNVFVVQDLTSPNASLRMDYSASTHLLTYYFDSNGGANSWVSMGTANLTSGTYNLGLSPSDTLTILLIGSSELQAVSSGQAYLSNLQITVSDAPMMLLPPVVAGGQFLLSWTAVQGKNYQLQYKTNLNQTNWSNLGNSVLATNTIVWSTNLIGPESQRFFRVQQN